MTDGQSAEDFPGSDSTLCHTATVGACPYTRVQTQRTHTTKSEPQRTLRTLGDMAGQCRFVDGDSCPTPVGRAASGGVCACVCGDQGHWELSVPSAQLSWEPNTALKKSIKNHFFTRMGTYVSTPSLLPNFLKQWYPFLQLSDFDSTVQNESKRLQNPLKIQSLEGALPNPVLS